MIYRVALLSLFVFGIFTSAFSQSYELAVGLRVGSQNGITLKSTNGKGLALEGMLVYHQGGGQVIGLVEYQVELGYGTDAYLVAGIGAHAGYKEVLNREIKPVPTVGADVLLGFEYEINRSMAFGIDVKPQFELINGFRISGNQAGVSLRFFLM